MTSNPNVLKAISDMPITPEQLSDFTEETIGALAGLSTMMGEPVSVLISQGGKIAVELTVSPEQAANFLSEPKSDI